MLYLTNIKIKEAIIKQCKKLFIFVFKAMIMTMEFVLGVSGSVIMILLSIISFFIAKLVNDIKACTRETGKNKGRIDLIAKQQENDVKRIEERTSLELRTLTQNVHELSENVNKLVMTMAKKGIENK